MDPLLGTAQYSSPRKAQAPSHSRSPSALPLNDNSGPRPFWPEQASQRAPRSGRTERPTRGSAQHGSPRTGRAGRRGAVTRTADRRSRRNRNSDSPPCWRLHTAPVEPEARMGGAWGVTSPGHAPLSSSHAPQAPPPARSSRLLASRSTVQVGRGASVPPSPAPAASAAPFPEALFASEGSASGVSASNPPSA